MQSPNQVTQLVGELEGRTPRLEEMLLSHVRRRYGAVAD
jgi:hypothetical protein